MAEALAVYSHVEAAGFRMRPEVSEEAATLGTAEASSSPQSGVLYDRANHVAVDSAPLTEMAKAPVGGEASLAPPKLGSTIQVPDIFNEPYRQEGKNLTYKALAPIQQRVEWLGQKVDERGKVIGEYTASVVGRTGQYVMYDHPGDVKEKMIKVTTYARWNPQHPDQSLLHKQDATVRLILGDTGPELEIVTYENLGVANQKEYSGWYNTSGQLEEVSLFKITDIEDSSEPAQNEAIDSNILASLPISIKQIDMYPLPFDQIKYDKGNTMDDKNVLVMPIITVADTYVAHIENVGYLQTKKEAYGGRPVSATVVGKKGELVVDPNTNERKVHTYTYVLKKPGQVILDEFAQREGLKLQTNFSGEQEYIIEGEISVDDAARYGYVFSAFEINKDPQVQEMPLAA